MDVRRQQAVHKEPLLDTLHKTDESAAAKYQSFFVGRPGWGALLRFEIAAALLGPLPGALGYALRKVYYPRLFKRVGAGVLWGRNISLRHPGAIEIGDRVGIDDDCLLDARGAGAEGVRIGDDVIIARNVIVQSKTAGIEIGARSVIGALCVLSSSGGIRLGRAVMLAGHCYIGGGRYHYDRRDVPIMDQGLYTEGPVVIEDDVWLGVGVTVLDGVHIGQGAVIGAGAVVRENVPAYTLVTPYQKLVSLPRGRPSE